MGVHLGPEKTKLAFRPFLFQQGGVAVHIQLILYELQGYDKENHKEIVHQQVKEMLQRREAGHRGMTDDIGGPHSYFNKAGGQQQQQDQNSEEGGVFLFIKIAGDEIINTAVANRRLGQEPDPSAKYGHARGAAIGVHGEKGPKDEIDRP